MPIPHPAELLQQLIRFNTTNPPGNEADCVVFIQNLLAQAGIESALVARTPERPNVVARLHGDGNAPPLLLYGHTDVVTTAGQHWQHPPFEGKIVDGMVWGRGALDMKGPLAMLLVAFLRAKAEGAHLPGDVIFAAVADEEAGGDFGARFLVEQHAGLFQNVRYALGEFGGFNIQVMGRRFYPIMIGEKQICWMKAAFRGKAGHGSMPIQGGAMAKAARAMHLLDQRHLPIRVTPPVRLMIERMAAQLPGAAGLVFGQLANPLLADQVLKLMGGVSKAFSPLLRNTVSPTMIQGSDKVNVIPAEVSLGLDGRLVPGGKPEEMEAELRALLGTDFDLELIAADPGPAAPDMGLFDTLGGILQELDPPGRPVPLVLPGVTDARFFSRLGIQTYGFTPLQLPEELNFIGLGHSADERVPVAALEFGTQAILTALQRFHE